MASTQPEFNEDPDDDEFVAGWVVPVALAIVVGLVYFGYQLYAEAPADKPAITKTQKAVR